MGEKIHEKRKKRFARYKKKREAKKLMKNPEQIQNNSIIKNSQEVKNIPPTKKKDITAVNKIVTERGFKRTIPKVIEQGTNQNRKTGNKRSKKEEEKFNTMVQHYKKKLFGNNKKPS